MGDQKRSLLWSGGGQLCGCGGVALLLLGIYFALLLSGLLLHRLRGFIAHRIHLGPFTHRPPLAFRGIVLSISPILVGVGVLKKVCGVEEIAA